MLKEDSYLALPQVNVKVYKLGVFLDQLLESVWF